MNVCGLSVAVLAMAVGIGGAQALTVHRSITVTGAPATVWWDIGSFCEIGDWHPAVEDCDDHWEDGAFYRTLTLKGGGSILERRTEIGPMTYSYEIIESPLPVANYHSTLKASMSGSATLIEWSGTFDAAGATDAEAASVIGGIYEAGLNEIAADRGD